MGLALRTLGVVGGRCCRAGRPARLGAASSGLLSSDHPDKLPRRSAPQMAMGIIRTRSTVGPNVGKLRFTDLPGTGSIRNAYVSETPCDLSKVFPWSIGPTVDATIFITVGGSGTYYANLKPDTSYYVHLLYRTKSGVACATGFCGTLFEIQPPVGH